VEINTNTLGPIEIDENRVVEMVEPIAGVETFGNRYALIDINPDSPAKLFQSVENPHICFLVGDPSVVVENYVVNLAPDKIADMDIGSEDEVAVLVIMNALVGGQSITANLKAPIIINRTNLKGKQVIMQDSAYSTRQVLNIKPVG
jgi:flagellar assembly factor FliW